MKAFARCIYCIYYDVYFWEYLIPIHWASEVAPVKLILAFKILTSPRRLLLLTIDFSRQVHEIHGGPF